MLLLAWLVLAMASLQGVSLHKHVDHHGHPGGLHLAQAPDHQPHHDATEEVEITGVALPVSQTGTEGDEGLGDANAQAPAPSAPTLAQRPHRAAVDPWPTDSPLPRTPNRRVSLPRGPPA